MTKRASTAETPVWLGSEAFGDGKLWIGQHDTDQDVLIFDPSEADPHAEVLSLYSLTQHRTRRFPRAIVLQRIQALNGDGGLDRAKSDYEQRDALRAAYEAEQAMEAVRSRSRQKEGVLSAHRRYLESLGLPYEGSRETGPDHRPGRRTKCHTCGIVLDDFAGAVCITCDGVLCSCGSCACGR
jgi:hypothetical protein